MVVALKVYLAIKGMSVGSGNYGIDVLLQSGDDIQQPNSELISGCTQYNENKLWSRLAGFRIIRQTMANSAVPGDNSYYLVTTTERGI